VGQPQSCWQIKAAKENATQGEKTEDNNKRLEGEWKSQQQ